MRFIVILVAVGIGRGIVTDKLARAKRVALLHLLTSAVGTKFRDVRLMSAFGGKADMG